MGCFTCRSECGREDGCGARKAQQREILDGLVARLYPGRTWGEADPAVCFGAGLREGEVRALGRALSVALRAPTFFREGGEDDLCNFLYVLCLGREPALLDVREEGLGLLGELGAEALRERYLRVALSRLGRLAAVQEVAFELDTVGRLVPEGMAVLREIPRPGVFDPKLLKRFQKAVDLLTASQVEHLDMGLLDLPASQYGLKDGEYQDRYGTAPSLFNFFFSADPVETASAIYLPLPGALAAQPGGA